ncbi:hypothetical protein EJV47_23220 [Hymenobacter gummosus]|uniref:Uncharacterized protein n=1 Tax=Hymenobacter gummosus TaxID=1776032 RepID=A0A431TX09_9BACT|nr:hypothetical protein [Hymenobacter gummosus]RTQ46067.1 hypothetical protein EJV47_23220 [Hymenobacter gummosus]
MHLELFTARLRQAIHWTERLAAGFDFERGNYGTVFRQTNPLIDGQLLYHIDGDYTTWNVDVHSLNNYQQALRAALAQRVAALPEVGVEAKSLDLPGLGRVLLFETQYTTHDGIAIAESKCFVDESEVPPIDTWFHLQEQVPGYRTPILYCWIPKAFEGVMQDAIDVEMLGSYEWLDVAAPELYNEVIMRL